MHQSNGQHNSDREKIPYDEAARIVRQAVAGYFDKRLALFAEFQAKKKGERSWPEYHDAIVLLANHVFRVGEGVGLKRNQVQKIWDEYKENRNGEGVRHVAREVPPQKARKKVSGP